MAKLNQDMHVSAEFIALIKAGFFGQVLFESALARLEPSHEILPRNYLETAHKALDKVDGWLKDLVEELPLVSLSWRSAETFDAIAAMSFLREFKRESLWITPQIEAALYSTSLPKEPDAVKLLAAGLLRSAATRSCYVESLSGYFADLKATDLSERVGAEVPGAKEYFAITNSIVDIFTSASSFTAEMCEKLRKEALLVPSDLRSCVHDVNVLLNRFSREFTYDMADFSPEEAREWEAAQVPALTAGYWRAYQFTPQELYFWAQSGISSAPLAALWRRANFVPDEAIRWIQEGIAPIVATTWRAAGFDPPRTLALIRRGFTDPTKAPRYDNEAPDEADEWAKPPATQEQDPDDGSGTSS